MIERAPSYLLIVGLLKAHQRPVALLTQGVPDGANC